MQAAASRLREHQLVFCGLEVLRLMAERMENRDEVDGQFVLSESEALPLKVFHLSFLLHWKQ